MLTLMVCSPLLKGWNLISGYKLAVFNSTDYVDYTETERVWVKLAALRDAMTQNPSADWFWYLDQVYSLSFISRTLEPNLG